MRVWHFLCGISFLLIDTKTKFCSTQYRNQASEYDNSFEEPSSAEGDYYLDSPAANSIEDMKHVEQRADVRADVPKHAGKSK